MIKRFLLCLFLVSLASCAVVNISNEYNPDGIPASEMASLSIAKKNFASTYYKIYSVNGEEVSWGGRGYERIAPGVHIIGWREMLDGVTLGKGLLITNLDAGKEYQLGVRNDSKIIGVHIWDELSERSVSKKCVIETCQSKQKKRI